MIEENQRKENLCMFYASDYHFEMITIPYISKKLNNNNILILTENNLDNSVEKVLSRINLENIKKEEIKNIGWKNNNIEKLKNSNDNKDAIIFIKGNKNYINEMNKNVRELMNNNNAEIIDCYDLNEVESDVKNIAKMYNNILSTSGIEKMLK